MLFPLQLLKYEHSALVQSFQDSKEMKKNDGLGNIYVGAVFQEHDQPGI